MFLTTKTLSLFVTTLAIFCVGSHAEQISFSKEKHGDDYHFNYQWKTQNKETKQLSFPLSQDALLNKFRDFKAYKPVVAQQVINQSLYRAIKKTPMKGVRVHFQNSGENMDMRLVSRDDELINAATIKIKALERQITQDYFEDNYYQHFVTFDQQRGVKPHHVNFAKDSVEDLRALKAIMLEQVSIRSVRSATDFALSFVQTIPYSTLESRVSSPGAGFSPPLRVLWENKGDCDSKVTLTASLLRMLMPRVKIALIFIDQHALIGIEVPPLSGDESITHDDVIYALAEPTGPRLLSLGKIAESSAQAIAAGHYVIEEFHAETIIQ